MSKSIWWISKYAEVARSGEPTGRAQGLLREFARRNNTSCLITSYSMGRLRARRSAARYETSMIDGVTITTIRTFQYSKSLSARRIISWISFEWGLLRLPSRHLPRPDAIVVSSLSLLTILNGLRLRKIFQCRLVFDVRDIWPLVLIEEGGFSRRNPFVRLLTWVEKVGYRYSDAIVGTMPNLQEHVTEVLGAPKSVHYIPHGFDESLTDIRQMPSKQTLRDKTSTDRFVVAYAGSVEPSNSMDVFFDCAKSMSDHRHVHFLVLGFGERLKYFQQRYGYLQNLTLLPPVPKSQVLPILRQCDLMYLSIRDSMLCRFGRSLNKLIDYALSGKPIVASYSGFPLLIDEARCGMTISPGDVEALRSAVLEFVAMEPERRIEIGTRGYQWVYENRTYSKLAEKYFTILFPQA